MDSQQKIASIDFRQKVTVSQLNQFLQKLRVKIKKQRDEKCSFVSYKILFPEGVKLHPKNDKDKTQKNEQFIVQLNPLTLYPRFINQKQCVIYRYRQSTKKTKQTKTFKPYYDQFQYCVYNAIGVLIAQQLRFNTLNKMDEQQKYQKKAFQIKDLFDSLVLENYKLIYHNWNTKSLQVGFLVQPFKVKIQEYTAFVFFAIVNCETILKSIQVFIDKLDKIILLIKNQNLVVSEAAKQQLVNQSKKILNFIIGYNEKQESQRKIRQLKQFTHVDQKILTKLKESSLQVGIYKKILPLMQKIQKK